MAVVSVLMLGLFQFEDPAEDKSYYGVPPTSTSTKGATGRPSVSWKTFCQSVGGEGEARCAQFRGLARAVVGSEESSDLLDEACLDLVQIFSQHARLTLEIFKTIKLKYGTLSQTNAEKMFRLSKEILESSSEKVREMLIASPETEEEDVDYFGKNIPFHVDDSDYLSRFDLSYLQDVEEPDFSLNDNLSFALGQTVARQPSKPPSTRASDDQSPRLEAGWLEDTVRSCYGEERPLGLSVPEFLEMILTLLSSDKGSEALQTELFDLCGFERFDMIGAVLERRTALVRSLQENKASMKAEIMSAAASVREREAGPARPNYGCQVTVQSEEEKALLKQMRKEEKKINKLLSKAGVEEEEEEFVFDPIDLRTKRQAALANAMNTPLFKERQEAREMSTVETFPFVFDSMNTAKLTSGFIQGTKMSLPVGFTRKDEKKWEEVTVPAENKAGGPPPTGKKLVNISSLDEIGQLAFKGIKQLNTIQSCVFQSAYNTSENLLVCAPTGAGKTNVAMLTMVQCIKQHMEAGVIKKDKFKIVYVAPMKALAAEMTAGFGKRLEPLGITVRELTGDMSLTKAEIANTQVLVTTPEKWDVVTRKPGDVGLATFVRLLIIDEVS